MTQYELNPEIFKMVEKQIIDNDPACARLAFNRLMETGYSQMETLEMIGGVLVQHMNSVMMFGHRFDEADYALQLDRLVTEATVIEQKEVVLDEIQTEKHAGYDALMQGNKEEMAAHFRQGFALVKQIVEEQFADKKPTLQEVEEKTEFKYGLFAWFEDMERELGAAGMQEERVELCKEMLETFAWNEGAKDGFRAAIGEAYHGMGKLEECKQYFDAWLAEEPENPVAVNSYLYCLVSMNEIDRAKEVAEAHINDSLECDLDTETLFYRAQTVFEQTGDQEKAAVYADKIAAFHEKCLDLAKAYEAEKAKAGTKVYPNDPCPCGSGKKYKKCCGKN